MGFSGIKRQLGEVSIILIKLKYKISGAAPVGPHWGGTGWAALEVAPVGLQTGPNQLNLVKTSDRLDHIVVAPVGIQSIEQSGRNPAIRVGCVSRKWVQLRGEATELTPKV